MTIGLFINISLCFENESIVNYQYFIDKVKIGKATLDKKTGMVTIFPIENFCALQRDGAVKFKLHKHWKNDDIPQVTSWVS